MVRGCLISWLWLFERNLVLLWNMIRFSYHRRTPTPNMATLILCCITLFYKDTLLLTQPVVISLFPSLCREGSTLWLHKLYIKLRIMEQVSLKQCHPHDVLETYFMWKFHRWELFFLFHQKVVHVLVLLSINRTSKSSKVDTTKCSLRVRKIYKEINVFLGTEHKVSNLFEIGQVVVVL